MLGQTSQSWCSAAVATTAILTQRAGSCNHGKHSKHVAFSWRTLKSSLYKQCRCSSVGRWWGGWVGLLVWRGVFPFLQSSFWKIGSLITEESWSDSLFAQLAGLQLRNGLIETQAVVYRSGGIPSCCLPCLLKCLLFECPLLFLISDENRWPCFSLGSYMRGLQEELGCSPKWWKLLHGMR